MRSGIFALRSEAQETIEWHLDIAVESWLPLDNRLDSLTRYLCADQNGTARPDNERLQRLSQFSERASGRDE